MIVATFTANPYTQSTTECGPFSCKSSNNISNLLFTIYYFDTSKLTNEPYDFYTNWIRINDDCCPRIKNLSNTTIMSRSRTAELLTITTPISKCIGAYGANLATFESEELAQITVQF